MNPKTKTIEIPARDIHPGDRVIRLGSQGRRAAREVTGMSAHLGGRERLLEFKDGGPDLIVKPDHCLTVEEGEAGRAARRAAGEAYTRIGPGAREIEAGDEVVVLDGKGGIDQEGVLCDVFDGDRAEVQTGTRKWIMVPLDLVAHLDSAQGEACAMTGAEAGAAS